MQDWTELSPEAGYLVSAMDQYMFIIMLVILLALCFVIVNTMLMVVLELSESPLGLADTGAAPTVSAVNVVTTPAATAPTSRLCRRAC